ncbi:response regulator receiver domain [Chloroflexota bacterium]
MIECDFIQQSRRIVETFLQSVVIVDDRDALGVSGEAPITEPEASIDAPPPRPEIGTPIEQTEESSNTTPQEDQGDDTAEQQVAVLEGSFDAKKIIDTFADKGITCAALQPKTPPDREKLRITIPKLANRADILIFDYSLGDGGACTRNIIQNLVRNDEENKDRLRLIIIYTIATNLLDILKAIKNEIQSLPEAPVVVEQLDKYYLQIKSTRIVTLLKHDAKVPEEAEELLKRRVSFSNLVDRAINEFTDMINGLVPNVALQSLSEIRKNTSKILEYYNRSLDVPYLAHRALLDDTDTVDAEGHIVELFSTDLAALLEETNVKKYVDIDRITEWLEFRELSGVKFIYTKINGEEKELTRDQVAQILTVGVSNTDLGLQGNDKKRQKNNPQEISLSQVFSGKKPATYDDEKRFAHISAFRTFFGDLVPVLNLGTVIQDDEENYLVCIQPSCDCVRIDKPKQFLFLPLEKKAETGFDLILKNDREYVTVRTRKKVYLLESLVFNGAALRLVTATKDGADFYFSAEPDSDTATSKKYKWIGELRLEQSISLSNSFAAELARVGFTESEWLRLHAKKQ